ncbi:MAG: amidohydrolase family protein [Omnitrophica WOR_2 bacterium]
MPEFSDPRVLVDWARDLGASYPFIDFHAHPYDVYSADTAYQENSQVEGLFSKGAFAYHPPEIESDAGHPRQPLSKSAGAIRLASRLTYTHTGPKVFSDQLEQAGISGALLLPVARRPGTAWNLLDATSEMFSMDSRLFLGCPFPVGLKPEELYDFYFSALQAKGIRVIKIHPNLAGIDPLTTSGIELIEATLVAANSLGLPVIVHTGFTPGLDPAGGGDYAALANLASLNWSLTSAPVILAHAGCYGLNETESDGVISLLETLLEKNLHLLADTSALQPAVLQLLLSSMDSSRLIFGSDTLYFPIWKAWIAFLRALRFSSARPDDDLVKIASLNPARCLSPDPLSLKQAPTLAHNHV